MLALFFFLGCAPQQEPNTQAELSETSKEEEQQKSAPSPKRSLAQLNLSMAELKGIISAQEWRIDTSAFRQALLKGIEEDQLSGNSEAYASEFLDMMIKQVSPMRMRFAKDGSSTVRLDGSKEKELKGSWLLKEDTQELIVKQPDAPETIYSIRAVEQKKLVLLPYVSAGEPEVPMILVAS